MSEIKKWAIGPRFHHDLKEGIGWWIEKDEDELEELFDLRDGFASLEEAEKFFREQYSEDEEIIVNGNHGCDVLYQHGEIDFIAWNKKESWTEESRVYQYEETEA